jgi:hypothetical protein
VRDNNPGRLPQGGFYPGAVGLPVFPGGKHYGRALHGKKLLHGNQGCHFGAGSFSITTQGSFRGFSNRETVTW